MSVYGNAFTLSSVGPGFSAFQPPPAAPTTQTPAAISLFGPNGRTHPPFYNGMQQQRSQQPSYPAATGTHNPTMSAFATPGVLPPPTTFASAQPSPSAGRPVYTSPFNQQIPPMASHSQHSSNMYARAAPGTTPGATPVSTADGATNTNTNANMSTQSSYPPPQGGSPSSQNNSAGNRNSMS
ncbi:hypothetical protein SBRCBS47491_001381 [Sporothrix bragantina]|uniref:Uncharacterized protein n=1 Tax=Sporothrix bragantina TaxID=671064 RepID=A0ABP0AXZ6_9PEZI